MKIIYDGEADAAYIQLITEDSNSGWVKRTIICDLDGIDGMINLDFDDGGRLGGIEILDATKMLPSDVLKSGL